ncbi:FG-GAP-like repeat-containing protein [Streptomyces poonensis]|uniref:FG-GAP-like repeat-containing protein n=1 Tax=Streptomyces poonensis TaxID=68255 RepID=UPI00227D7EAB|nr:FG-GAP-like repeat-containing protein [Streptomyces poonensis]
MGSAVATVSSVLALTAGAALSLPSDEAQAAQATAGTATEGVPTAGTTAVGNDVAIPVPDTDVDRRISVLASTRIGVLYQEEGTDGYVWSQTGKVVPALDGVPAEDIVDTHDEYDRIAYRTTGADGRTTFVWYWLNDGIKRTMTVPSGYENPRLSSGFVVVSHRLEDGSYEYRVLRGNGTGGAYDVLVRLPEGATAEAAPEVLAHDGNDLVIRYQKDGQAAYGIVNGISGAVQPLQATGAASSFRLTDSWVTWFTREGEDGIRIRARSSAGGAPGIRAVPTTSEDSEVLTFMTGDHLLWWEGPGSPLYTKPLSGGEPKVAVAEAERVAQAGENVTAVGRAVAGGPRALYDLYPDGTGALFVFAEHEVTPVHHDGSVTALDLDRGTVRLLNSLRGTQTLHSQDIGTAMAPAGGAALTSAATSATTGPGRFADGGDEGLAQLATDPATGKDVLTTADDPDGAITLPGSDGRILDASPQYVLYAGNGGTGRQYVVDIAAGTVVREQAAKAAALDHATLWTPSTTAGKVVATSLRTGKTVRTLDIGSGCVPDDLRTNGTLLYWSCAAQKKAGVKNLGGMGQAYSAPVGDVLLGDGFYGYYNAAEGSIELREVINDVNLPLDEITGVAPTEAADTRGVTWAIDPRSNKVAYLGADGTVHVVRAYMGIGLPSRLSVPDSTVPASFAADGGAARWNSRWWLSKPAASWKVTLKSATTKAVVRTWTGGATRGSVAVSWDGKAQTDGALVTNGSYTWTLTAVPADGAGDPLSSSGTVKVTGAAAVRRDHAGSDGIGDVLTLNSKGDLTIQQGNGKGALSGKVSGAGWPTSITAAPFGDLDGDRCNDVLVRYSSGTLRGFRPGCGKAVTPKTAYTTLGTGFQQYNVLTSPGDVTGDKRADLIARNSKTGAVYLYKGTSSGKLSSRVKLYANWNGYKKIVGAGDLNGDGHGDLLVQNKSNELWRYDGTGKGPFKARVKVAGNWGSAYNAVVGAGDLTGDGKADLVSRDTSGNLWRSSGNGKGSFGARTKIATGWKGYKGVF